jgi:glycosyltransferase involved in cell wall biosynthesis
MEEHKVKVLLTNFHPGNGGGHRTYLLSLLKGPLGGQFDLALACPSTSSINALARQNGGTVFDHDFPGNAKEFLQVISSVRKLDRLYRRFPFDIIHCNGSRDHWIALYWKTAFRRPARIVRSRHAVKEIGNDFFHAWANNRATDLNIYVSRGMVPLCEPPGKLKLEKAAVIAHGVDTDHFQPREKDLSLAAQLGIGEADFVVGSNAGLGGHKRVDLMLQAASELPRRENLKILLLGEEGSARVCLGLARQLGLEKNVAYGGMRNDIRPYLTLFDLGFVLSERIETSSYAAKEMMAMGIPLVCTRYSGLPENVDEGENGFLIAPGQVQELRRCLTTFQEMTPAERMKFRAHSRAKAVKEFSWQAEMNSLAQAYRDVLARISPSGSA